MTRPVLGFLAGACMLLLTQREAHAQSCPASTKIVTDALYDTYNLDRRRSTREAYFQWFSSKKFEQTYRNNTSGLSLTIPLKGIPITFGGSSESKDAWRLWQENQNISDWTFSEDFFEKVVSRVASDRVRLAWIDAIKQCNNPSLVTAEGSATRDEAIVTLRATYVEGAPDVVMLDIVCSASLSCQDAAARSRGGVVKPGGVPFRMEWATPSATQGTIVFYTSRGVTQQLNLDRPATGTFAVVTYIGARTTMKKAGERYQDAYLPGYSNVDCDGRPPCDPSNRWRATVFPLGLTADPGNELRNPRAECRGGTCPWSRPDAYEYFTDLYVPGNARTDGVAAGRTIAAYIRNWSVGTAYRLTADVYTPGSEPFLVQKVVPFAGRLLTITVPVSVEIATCSFSLNDQPVLFTVGKVPDGGAIKLRRVLDLGTELQYDYELP